MRMNLFLPGMLSLLLLFASAVPAFAADTDELERRIDLLSDEVDRMKMSGGGAGQDPDRIRFHGYGELHYNNRMDNGDAEFDQHRFALGLHALLADWIHLNAEFDFEHALQELEFEYGYLDFLFSPEANVRAGVVLTPVGFLNEFHEPTLFWSVERPDIHSVMIPTTWQESGVGVFGTPMDGLNYRVYLTSSLQSIRPEGVTNNDGCGGDRGHGIVNPGGKCGRFTDSGIRSGRRQPDEQLSENIAFAGRAEYSKALPGLNLGFSFFTGNTTQGFISEGGRTTILEGDIKYRYQWFDMNATLVNTFIADAEAMNNFCANHAGCTGGIAGRNFGWNVQVGVHLLQALGMNTTHDLVPFFLFEQYDTQLDMPSNASKNLAREVDVYTVGMSYMPIPSVAIKWDYQQKIDGRSQSSNFFNAALAYMF